MPLGRPPRPGHSGSLLAASILLAAAPAPAAAQPQPQPPPEQLEQLQLRGVVVGDLREAAARRRFLADVERVCRRQADIAEERVADPAPAGTVLRQSPGPGTRLPCARPAVTLVTSSGPAATRPADDVTRPPADQPASAIPLLTVPRFQSARDVDLFVRFATRRCRSAPDVARSSRASDAPAGTVLAQQPAAGTRIPCQPTPRLELLLSSGPAAPDPVQSFPIGELATARARAALEIRAARLCQQPFRIAVIPEPSRLAEGSFLAQSPPPETLFACDLAIEVRVAGPPPPPPPEPLPPPPPDPG
ncbi:MAG: hypothetical protein ACK4TG_10730, partial [Thermaurantiacus sp.]